MAIFQYFKMAAAAILDFQNAEILGVGRLKTAEMRHRAKFCGDRYCWDMAIFRFFKMAGFLKDGNFRGGRVKRAKMCHLPKFHSDRSNRC